MGAEIFDGGVFSTGIFNTDIFWVSSLNFRF